MQRERQGPSQRRLGRIRSEHLRRPSSRVGRIATVPAPSRDGGPGEIACTVDQSDRWRRSQAHHFRCQNARHSTTAAEVLDGHNAVTSAAVHSSVGATPEPFKFRQASTLGVLQQLSHSRGGLRRQGGYQSEFLSRRVVPLRDRATTLPEDSPPAATLDHRCRDLISEGVARRRLSQPSPPLR